MTKKKEPGEARGRRAPDQIAVDAFMEAVNRYNAEAEKLGQMGFKVSLSLVPGSTSGDDAPPTIAVLSVRLEKTFS